MAGSKKAGSTNGEINSTRKNFMEIAEKRGVEPTFYDMYTRCLDAIRSIANQGNENKESESPEDYKNIILHLLDKEIARLKRYKHEQSRIQTNSMEVQSLRANVRKSSRRVK